MEREVYHASHYELGPFKCDDDDCEAEATHGVRIDTPIGATFTVGHYCELRAIFIVNELDQEEA